MDKTIGTQRAASLVLIYIFMCEGIAIRVIYLFNFTAQRSPLTAHPFITGVHP
jgi:hypothetical protein